MIFYYLFVKASATYKMRGIVGISLCLLVVAVGVFGQTMSTTPVTIPLVSLIVAVPVGIFTYKCVVFAGQLRHSFHGMVSHID